MIWVILGVTVFLGTMLFTVLLLAVPQVVRVFKPILCGPDEELDVHFETYSYHRIGERAIVINKVGPNGTRSVQGAALFLLWLLCVVICLPISYILVSTLLPSLLAATSS